MRTFAWLIVLQCLSVSGPAAAQTCAPRPAGLIAWWPGEGTGNDLAGDNWSVESSAAGITFAPGIVGKAFAFSGGWMSMGDGAAIIGTGPFTVDAWINTTAPTGVVINQRGTEPDAFLGEYVMAIGGGMVGSPGEPFASGPGQVCWSTFGEDWGFNVCSKARVDDGKWHHVAVLRESDGTGKIYIDAVFDSSEKRETQSLIKVPVYLGADVRIGSHFGGRYWTYYTGLLDEVHIINRALAPAEIRTIYSAGQLGLCKDAATPARP